VTRIIRPLLRMVTPQLRVDSTKTEKKVEAVAIAPAPVPSMDELWLTVPPIEPLRAVVVEAPSAKAQATSGSAVANVTGSAPMTVADRDPIQNIGDFLRTAPAPISSDRIPVGESSGGGALALADAKSAPSKSTTPADVPAVDSTGRMTLGGGGGTPTKFELTDNTIVHTRSAVIGDTGLGYFHQSGGTHQVDGELALGKQKGSKGVYDLDGGNLRASALTVGGAGEGIMNQTGGVASADTVEIGKEESGVGTYILDGESALNGGKITVAVRGTGTLDNRNGVITLSAGQTEYSSNWWTSEAMEPAVLNVAENDTATGNMVIRDGRLLFQSGQFNPALRVGVGGDGTLTIGNETGRGGVEISEGKNVKTNLVVRAYASGRGVLKGWGDVFLTGTLIMNGKTQADGFNTERTLDLSHFGAVDNRIENPIEGGTNGWVAKRKGALALPPVPVTQGTGTYNWGESETDKIIDLVNSVRFTVNDAKYAGEVKISLLATDRSDIPALPSAHHFLSIWSFDPSDIEAEGGFDITVRYNDVLAKSLGIREEILKFWAYDGAWVRINDDTFHRDLTKNLIGGHFDHATFFAVSAPEPSGVAAVLMALGTLGLRRRRAA